MSIIKNQQDLNNLRYSCRIVASCHYHLKSLLKPGISAKEVDDFCREFGAKYDAKPAFMTKDGYKYTITFSIDNEITHGLPLPDRKIPESCLLKVDTGFIYKGMVSDMVHTYVIGNPPKEDIWLSKKTEEGMRAGIATVHAGATLGDIGAAVDAVARKNKLGNIKVLGGHGLGYGMHEEPFVAHYGKPGKGRKLFKNQVITIEPMFTLGTSEAEFDQDDGWTIRTKDGSHAAQWEADILVTEKGSEVLTDIKEDQILPI